MFHHLARIGTLQLELLDTRTWATRQELANAIFEWIEAWYNPTRRHSSLGLPQWRPAEWCIDRLLVMGVA